MHKLSAKEIKKNLASTILFSRGHPVCGVKMVAIALRVEMKLRGRFTTYPKNRKPKEMLCYCCVTSDGSGA